MMRRMKRRRHPLALLSPPPLASTYPILHLRSTWRPRTTQASGGILVNWKSEENIKITISDIMHLEKKKKKKFKTLAMGVSSIVHFHLTCAFEMIDEGSVFNCLLLSHMCTFHTCPYPELTLNMPLLSRC